MQGYQPQYQQQMPPQYQMPPQMNWQQQRIAELEQRMPQAPFQQQQNPIVSQPVTSMDEAKAAPISFDDRIYVFVNMSVGEIYVKRWDRNTGGAAFSVFTSEQIPQTSVTNETTVQKSDMELKIEALEEKVLKMEELLNDTTTNTKGSKSKPANAANGASSTVKPKSDGDVGTSGTK